MQRAAQAGNEAAALFLATHGAKVNHINKWVCMNIMQHITAKHDMDLVNISQVIFVLVTCCYLKQ